jgi:hypothetical protein
LTSQILSDDGHDQEPPGYGLNSVNAPIFIRNLKSLARFTYLWPPVDQASTIGSKWQLVENLDIIAALNNQIRPQSRLMKSGDYISDKTVLKRTHSESGNHIIFPQDMLGKRTWEYMDAHSEIPRCRWFSQTYVPLLKDYGEWRVVIVGGAPAYTVHTQPASGDRWKYRNTTAFWPLHKLRCVNTTKYPFCY